MDVKELCNILEHLRVIHDAEGAKTQAKDFQRVISILAKHKDETVVDFVKNTQQLLTTPASNKKIMELDEISIKRFVDRLKKTGTDRVEFEVVYKDLSENRQMRKQEVIEVAHGYTGYKMSYKTKKKALDEIRAKFTEIARHDARMSIIDRVTPW